MSDMTFPWGLPTAASEPDPGTLPYWTAAREGRFVLPWCERCSSPFWYPRAFCPRCGWGEVRWRDSRGRGHVFTSTVVRRAAGLWAAHVPFCVAMVVLDEGIAITANIVGAHATQVLPDSRVVAVFEQGPDGHLPALRFTPEPHD